MQPEKNSRLDTRDLKAQLLKKVGQESFKRYFHSLNRFINQKLSKSEFDKSCYRILGRENLPLHNQIIKAILKNAYSARTTPPKALGMGPAAKRCSPVLEDGHNQGVVMGHHQSSVDPIWSNGDVRMSPRKGRSTIPRSPLIAPLGIPYCLASNGGSRKVSPVTHIGDYVSCFDFGRLSGSEMLRRRMEQLAASQGLGVTLECANTLNNMVNVYLKRLISSGLEVVGSRSISNMSTNPIQKQQINGKPINGLWPSNHMHMQNSQSVSLLDFEVAMKLNPQQLGENWPLLLEKVSMKGFEEEHV